MDTIFAILFHELILLFWGFWALSALIFGWLLVGSIDDPNETIAAAGAVAAFEGIFSASSGAGFIQGFTGAIHNLFVGFILVPGWPAVYLLPLGWCVGEMLGLPWWGVILCCFGGAFVGAMVMGLLWMFALASLRNALPHFLAAIMVIPLFGVAPLIAFAAGLGGEMSCGA